MNKLTYSNVFEYLLESLPEFRRYYDDRARELYAFDNPHVIYGSILVDYIDVVTQGTPKQFNKPNYKLPRNIFVIIEDLSSSHDFEVRCLIETGFLEALLRKKGDLNRFSWPEKGVRPEKGVIPNFEGVLGVLENSVNWSDGRGCRLRRSLDCADHVNI